MTDFLSLPSTRASRRALACLLLVWGMLACPEMRAADEHAQLDEKTSEELGKIKELTDAKNWDAAVSLLDNLLTTVSPTSFDTAVVSEIKAKVYLQKGDYSKALEPMETAVRLSDTYSYLEEHDVQELVYYLANIYNSEAATSKSPAVQQQYFIKACDYAKRWLLKNTKSGQDPQRQEVMLFYASMLYNRAVLNAGKTDLDLIKQCQAEVENDLLSINRPKETFYVLLLATLQQEGNYVRAGEVLELLAKQYPTKKEYWPQLVPIYLNLALDKNEEKAREYNTRAIVTIERAQSFGFMKTPKENFNLVGLYFNAGQFGKATELLHGGLRSGAIASEQKNWELLAYSFQQVDQPLQAIEVLREAGQQFPRSGQIDYQIAQIYYSLEKSEDAYQSLVQATAKGHLDKPGSVYNFLAYTAFETNRFEEALVAVNKAIASPDSAHDAQLPRLKAAIEDSIKEREQLKSGARTH